MSLSKKLYYNLSSRLPTLLLKKTALAGTLFPYHHLVSDKEVLHIKHLYSYKNISQFKADLDHLLKHLSPVSVNEINESVTAGRSMPKNSFLLTFDDGFREVYDIISPILLEKGIPAIFFINPAFIDNHELFYRCKISLVIERILQQKNDQTILNRCRKVFAVDSPESTVDLISTIKKINNLNKDLLNHLADVLELSFTEYLKKEKPFLSTLQVIELSNKGFTIGAHSWDHPYYDLIPNIEKLEQTIQSTTYIADQFQQKIKTFSFPHSDKGISQSFFNELSLLSAPDLLFGIQNQKLEVFNKMLHRFNAEKPELPMCQQLNGVLLFMTIQRLMKKNIVHRS